MKGARRLLSGTAVVVAVLLAGCRESLPLATITSVDSPGLLDSLLSAFTKQTRVRAGTVAVDRGRALQVLDVPIVGPA